MNPALIIDGVVLPVRPSQEHEYLLETKLVAKGYGVSAEVIRTHKRDHADELVEGKHFISVGNPNANPRAGIAHKQTVWTKRGIIRLGFFIKSERAKKFRDIAEDLVIRATAAPVVAAAPATDPFEILRDPAAMRGLLLGYADKVIALEKKITAQAPVIKAYDLIATETFGSMCITDAAKHLQLKPKDLFALLSARGWIFRRAGGKAWLGYQGCIQHGLVEHKITRVVVDNEERMCERVLITAKGMASLAKLVASGKGCA